MKLDPRTVQALLPCYVCGDLDAELARQVRAAVAGDRRLQAQLGALSSSRDACVEALSVAAREVPELADRLAAPAPPVRRADRWPWGLVAGVAAAAALAVAVTRLDGGPGPQVDALAVHRAALEMPPEFIQTGDPATLSARLMAQGVLPAAATVDDLSAIGLTLIGGMKAPGGRHGAVILFDHAGTPVVCQMYTDLEHRVEARETLRVAGVTLRAFTQGDTSVVEWEMGGVVCLFSSRMPMDRLLALVRDRVTAAAG